MNGQQSTADLDESIEEQHRIRKPNTEKGESRDSRLFYFFLFTFALFKPAPGYHP